MYGMSSHVGSCFGIIPSFGYGGVYGQPQNRTNVDNLLYPKIHQRECDWYLRAGAQDKPRADKAAEYLVDLHG